MHSLQMHNPISIIIFILLLYIVYNCTAESNRKIQTKSPPPPPNNQDCRRYNDIVGGGGGRRCGTNDVNNSPKCASTLCTLIRAKIIYIYMYISQWAQIIKHCARSGVLSRRNDVIL